MKESGDNTMTRVSLESVLQAREWRQQQQQAMRQRHGMPLVSFTINMPGDIKVCPASRHAFDAGLDALDQVLAAHRWPCHERQLERSRCDQFALLAIGHQNAGEIKRALLNLEEHHPLGRLFDMDVISAQGQLLSRTAWGNPVRKCLLCDQPAVVCARSQTHGIHQLRHHIEQMVASARALP